MRAFLRNYLFKILLVIIVLQLGFFFWLEKRNHPPVAEKDQVQVVENRSVTIVSLKNDSDKEGSPLSIAEAGDPLHGKVIRKDNLFEYTPRPDFAGVDSFWYTITDGQKTSNKAYVVVEVLENRPPNAQRDMFKIFPWEPVALPVMNNDYDREGDSIFVLSFEQPVYGKVNQEDNTLVYTPPADKSVKTDSFSYVLSDGRSASEKTFAVIEIKEVPTPVFSPVPYYGDLRNYEQYNSSRWDIINDNGNYVVAINTTDYSNLTGNRPGAFNLIKDRVFTGDFNMQLRIKCTDDIENNSAADHAVYFAFVDYNNFCYASFSAHEEGEGFTGIFKIVDGERQSVVWKGQAFTDNEYHNYEVIRKGSEVILKVDGRELCRATDDAFGLAGQLGIGSYNDMANFDDIRISGKYE